MSHLSGNVPWDSDQGLDAASAVNGDSYRLKQSKRRARAADQPDRSPAA
jgi:hypothetical protein